MHEILVRPESAPNWRAKVSYILALIAGFEGYQQLGNREGRLQDGCLTVKTRLMHWAAFLVPTALAIHFFLEPEQEARIILSFLSFAYFFDCMDKSLRNIGSLRSHELNALAFIKTLRPSAPTVIALLVLSSWWVTR